MRRRNPDDAEMLKRLKLKIDKSRDMVQVRVYDGDKMVGGAMFERYGDSISSISTEVIMSRRRKGIASLIYRTLVDQGFRIHPGSMQTEAGEKLWKGGRWTRRNPDDAELLSRLTVKVDDDPAAMRGKIDTYVMFGVFDGKRHVADAVFRIKRAYAEAVSVAVYSDEYKRRGVASWLYRWVERETGLEVKHSKDQTPAGKAFAKGRRHNPDLELESKFDGLGLHHIGIKGTGILIIGGLPDFGRRPGIRIRGLDAKGRERLKYIIYDCDRVKLEEGQKYMTDAQTDASEAGYCVLMRGPGHEISGLIDIVIKPKFRKSGLGSKIVKALVAACKCKFDVFDVKRPAFGFWRKMGARPVKGNDWEIDGREVTATEYV